MMGTETETFGARAGNLTFQPGSRTNWHGATPEHVMTHMAIVTQDSAGETAWFEPVTDEEDNRRW